MGGLEACFIIKSPLVSRVSLWMKMLKGGKFLKKLWCCVRRRVQQGNLVLSTVLVSNTSDERVNARHVSLLNRHGGQLTSSTQLITQNYLENVTLLEAKKKFKNRASLDLLLPRAQYKKLFRKLIRNQRKVKYLKA